MSLAPIQFSLKTIYERRKEQGFNPGARQKIETKKVRGFITQDDMVRLDRYKKKIFFDYKNVEMYLNQTRQKNRGEKPQGAPVKTLMLNSADGLPKLDDVCSPLSSRSIVDYREHFIYKQPPEPGKSFRNKFEQGTRNTYFDHFETERLLKEARKAETEKERLHQM